MTETEFIKSIQDCKNKVDLIKIIHAHPKLKDSLAKWNGIFVKGKQVATELTKSRQCSLEMLKENVLEDADDLTHPIDYGDLHDPMRKIK